MPRWTAENLADYARRQLAASPNTRREIQERAQTKKPIITAEDDGQPMPMKLQKSIDKHFEAANERVKAHGARYSLPVVLAWFAECGLPAPTPEYRFHVERLWRFDFCWIAHRLAVEVQGGIFAGGAHVRGAALLREFEKLNAAAVAGYRVLFTTPDDLCTTDFAETIRCAINPQ